jgi:hypothetical protein
MSDVLMSDFWPTYDKAFDRGTQDWCIVSYVITDPKIIKTGLTEEEADAFLKLLRS